MSNAKTNLIINYLPQTLTDQEFRSMFLSIGEIKSSKICRDRATGYSYGYGFVDYVKEEDAVNAIATLHGLQLQNKKIKVAYARQGGDDIKQANLYIRGLPEDITEEKLKELFAECGEIIQCRLLTDQFTGASKGVGFVLFDQKKMAQAAMTKFNGVTLPGGKSTLVIKFAEENAKKVRAPPVPPGAFSPMNMGMGGMRGGYNYGSGPSGYGGGPMRGGQGGNRFRYNPMTQNFQQQQHSGLTVGEPGHILFVYNIGPDCTEKELWQLFNPYGHVTKCNVIKDAQKGCGKGYGFVTMVDYDEALWAIQQLNGFRFTEGKPLQVSFKTQN